MSLTENVKCPDKVSFPLIALCLLLSSLLETGVYIGMQGFPAFKKKKKKGLKGGRAQIYFLERKLRERNRPEINR